MKITLDLWEIDANIFAVVKEGVATERRGEPLRVSLAHLTRGATATSKTFLLTCHARRSGILLRLGYGHKSRAMSLTGNRGLISFNSETYRFLFDVKLEIYILQGRLIWWIKTYCRYPLR